MSYDRSLIEGPLQRAVWKIAWPTMVTNIIGGLQGIVDHVLVGHLVGFQGNAAIGVSWQIILVVIVFISSLFTGMSVLVARFAGAGEEDKVNRMVYQAFLTAIGLSLGIMAPLGYFLSPWLLDLVNAAPAVKTEALPFMRIMFVFSIGMLLFYMLSGALRSAGDARTPMMLGVALTVLNLVLNVILIRGLGPIPSYGTAGAAMGTVLASGAAGALRDVEALERRMGGLVSPRERLRAGLEHHPVAVPIRPADRHPGNRDERGWRVHARVHRLAGAERGGPGGVRRLLHPAVLTDHLDVDRPDGCRRGRGRSESRGGQRRRAEQSGAHRRGLSESWVRRSSASSFCSFPGNSLPSSA